MGYGVSDKDYATASEVVMLSDVSHTECKVEKLTYTHRIPCTCMSSQSHTHTTTNLMNLRNILVDVNARPIRQFVDQSQRYGKGGGSGGGGEKRGGGRTGKRRRTTMRSRKWRWIRMRPDKEGEGEWEGKEDEGSIEVTTALC